MHTSRSLEFFSSANGVRYLDDASFTSARLLIRCTKSLPRSHYMRIDVYQPEIGTYMYHGMCRH